MPHVGWSNAVPSAVVTGAFSLDDGSTYVFDETSLGYHDKNWGDIPFTEAINSWWWGHATLGPYTFVWFDGLKPDLSKFAEAYIAEQGNILTSTCATDSTTVTAQTSANGTITGINVQINTPNTLFNLSVKITGFILNGIPVYGQWAARVSGAVIDKRNPHILKHYDGGVAVFERFFPLK